MHINRTLFSITINDDIDASIYRASFISCFTDIVPFIFFFYTPEGHACVFDIYRRFVLQPADNLRLWDTISNVAS